MAYRVARAIWQLSRAPNGAALCERAPLACSAASAEPKTDGKPVVRDHKDTANVPVGHHESDLSDTACNIGLMRRRDLTLRQDLRLQSTEGGETTVADVFKGSKILLVGLPGGKVCAEEHFPGYVNKVSEIKSKQLDKVVCIVPQGYEALNAAITNAQKKVVSVYEDKDGGFVRLLGMDCAREDAKSQRFAGFVDDGILLRLVVEKSPGDVKLTHVDRMIDLWGQISKEG